MNDLTSAISSVLDAARPIMQRTLDAASGEEVTAQVMLYYREADALLVLANKPPADPTGAIVAKAGLDACLDAARHHQGEMHESLVREAQVRLDYFRLLTIGE